jgi:DNA-binding ferritin-like protein
MGDIFSKLNDLQQDMHNEVAELTQNIELNVMQPLKTYQTDVAQVRENRKDLKDAYDKIEQSRVSLEKARKDFDNAHRAGTQSSRLTMIGGADVTKKMNDIYKLEEKVQRVEKELDEANALANEKYDKYTEGLYKRVAEECELTSFYLDYLKLQKKYHKQALKRLDTLIPNVKESLVKYSRKPVFGSSLQEYVNMSLNSNPVSVRNHNNIAEGQLLLSPIIKKTIEGMCKQNVFNEEGIFRIAGSRIKMNCIIYAVNAGYLDYLDMQNDFDVHCLAGVLKQYFRELPDSVLCNELYENWIEAINTPSSNKLDAFKNVILRLPKTNYDNIKYLIKFLNKIVENCEKTKMNNTNMGICFGVSLLSNSSTLNMNITSTSNSSASSYSLSQSDINTITAAAPTVVKSIDMATATNVFDFLLNNHKDLFPGEINFSSNSIRSKPSFHQSNNSIHSANNKSFNNNNTNHNNTETITSNELTQQSPNTPLNNSATPAQSLSSSSSNNISNLNRHVKKNSMDSNKFIDNEFQTTPISSISGSISSINNINNNHTGSMTKQMANIFESSVSTSPKLKAKKQAPAPPPVYSSSRATQPSTNVQSLATNFYNDSSSNSNTSLQTTAHHNPSIILEKPCQPPPIVPNTSNRNTPQPPAIGFNVTELFADTNNTFSSTTTHNDTSSLPYPIFPILNNKSLVSSIYINSDSNNKATTDNVSNYSPNNLTSSTSSTISTSSSSSSSQEILNSPSNNFSSSTVSKPPQQSPNTKPIVPRKPVYQSKPTDEFVEHPSSNDIESDHNQTEPKCPSEITSL